MPAHRLKLCYINLTSSPLAFPTSKLLQTSILYFILITSTEIARDKETMKVKINASQQREMLLIECVVHLCYRSPSPHRPGRPWRCLDHTPQGTGVACQLLITILNLYLETYIS